MLKFNYCFNENLKFDFSVVQPKYLMKKQEEVDEIRKELTFDPRNNEDSDIFMSNRNFIKLNLSDSDSNEFLQNDGGMQTFTFRNSDEKGDAKINTIKSVIHEEGNEHDESNICPTAKSPAREVFAESSSLDHDTGNSPFRRMQLINSRSSPSLGSHEMQGFRLYGMQQPEDRAQDVENEDNVFKRKRKYDEESASDQHVKLEQANNSNKSEESKENADFVPLSPDCKMKRKRRQRANQIANNPLMLISAENCSNKTSSPGESEGG